MQMEGFAIKDFDHVNIANGERPTGDAILQQLIDFIKEKNLLIYTIVKQSFTTLQTLGHLGKQLDYDQLTTVIKTDN